MDIFGDLREWGRVLQELECLKTTGQLDWHQDGLARLLRYRDNWRIREKAAESLSVLSVPDDRILFLVLDIIGDEHSEFGFRTLAADSLRGLIASRQAARNWTADVNAAVVDRLRAAVQTGQPPLLERAIRSALDCASRLQHQKAIA